MFTWFVSLTPFKYGLDTVSFMIQVVIDAFVPIESPAVRLAEIKTSVMFKLSPVSTSTQPPTVVSVPFLKWVVICPVMFVPEMAVTVLSLHCVLLASTRMEGGVAFGSFELQIIVLSYLNLLPTLTPTVLV